MDTTVTQYKKELLKEINDFRHPSLHTKKIKGSEGIWKPELILAID